MAVPSSKPPLRPVALALAGALLIGHEWGRHGGASEHAAAATGAVQAGAETGGVDGTPDLFKGFGGERWAHARVDSRAAMAGADGEALAQLGYSSGSQAWTGHDGVTFHDRAAAEPGLNLAHFGHEQAAYLLDMDGEVVHRWSLDLAAQLGPDRPVHHTHWRRVRPFDDGGLLAIYSGQYLVKLDRESELAWVHDGGAHHDLDIDDLGRIHVLTRQTRVIGRIDLQRPCLEDFVTVLDADGTELRRVSVLEAFERSPWAPLLDRMSSHGDILHTNTLELLDGRWADRAPAFRKGNVLLSVRELDTIAVLDLQTERIVWALSGHWRAQHQPTVVDDGRLLLFDNKGHTGGMSRVIEFDPLSQEIAWMYGGDRTNGFYSAECGSVQRLPGGNTLITETDSGRAFEVTPAGEIAWEYRSPFRAGDQGQYVATLFEVVRLPEAFGSSWLAPGR